MKLFLAAPLSGLPSLLIALASQASCLHFFKKLVSAALASLQGPDAVAAIVDRRLTALEGAQSYIDWQKRRTSMRRLLT